MSHSGRYDDLNRPVHLARRDACVERAVEMLYMPLQRAGTLRRLRQVGFVARLLEGARKHAVLAMRSNRVPEEERSFERFLRLIHQNAQSIHALMENQAHIESEDHSFLARLLGEEQEQALLSALHCRRSAEDMLMGLSQILRMAHAPYRGLQRKNIEAMTDGDRDRYRRAHTSFHDELADEFPVSDADRPPPDDNEDEG